MTKTLKQFFSTNFPGMSVADACQSILDELDDIEVRSGTDTGTFRALIETILDDLMDGFTESDDPYDDY